MKVLAVLLCAGLAICQVDGDDHDSVYHGYEFIAHDSMDLLLILHGDSCYYVHSTDPGQVWEQHADDLRSMQSELVSIIRQQGPPVLTPTTLDAMRDKYRDMLADYHCRNHIVYEIHIQECDHDWTWFQGSCYKYVNADLSHGDASRHCKDMGSRLVEITSAQENDFVLGLSQHQRNSDRVWLGLSDRDHEGYFILPSTGQRAPYTPWLPGEPDNYINQDCMVLLPDSGYWQDTFCPEHHPSVCEK